MISPILYRLQRSFKEHNGTIIFSAARQVFEIRNTHRNKVQDPTYGQIHLQDTSRWLERIESSKDRWTTAYRITNHGAIRARRYPCREQTRKRLEGSQSIRQAHWRIHIRRKIRAWNPYESKVGKLHGSQTDSCHRQLARQKRNKGRHANRHSCPRTLWHEQPEQWDWLGHPVQQQRKEIIGLVVLHPCTRISPRTRKIGQRWGTTVHFRRIYRGIIPSFTIWKPATLSEAILRCFFNTIFLLLFW